MKEEMIKISEVGWREWLSLPELSIPAIKAKIDTGAKTSALHAFELETIKRNGEDYVRFKIHPLQKEQKTIFCCESKIYDQRQVKDSGGHVEDRFIIYTPVCLGGVVWDIEISLTARDDMLFRMLLGRSALVKQGLSVNPAKSYLTGETLAGFYQENNNEHESKNIL